MRTYLITDTVTGRWVAVASTDPIASILEPWYPQAPAEVTEAITGLEAAIWTRSQDLDELAAYLGVTVEAIPAVA